MAATKTCKRCCAARLRDDVRRYITHPICGTHDVRRPQDARHPSATV